MALKNLARPSLAATWLHGPPRPEPRTRPVSSPITAVVPDWPPSMPRKSAAIYTASEMLVNVNSADWIGGTSMLFPSAP